MVEGHHARIVFPDSFYRVLQPHDQPRKPFAAQLGAYERVPAVGDPGDWREIHDPVAAALHHLDEHCHALVVIQDIVLLAIEQHMGIVDAGIHPADGVTGSSGSPRVYPGSGRTRFRTCRQTKRRSYLRAG